jgi:SPP1 family predicted phage head-tail adaptor
VSPADLRHRVTIQARPTNLDGTPVKDAYGQGLQDWSDVATVMAAIEPIDGREEVAGAAVVGSTTSKLTVRWRSWITTKHRLVYAGNAMDIQSVVDVDERHFWTEIVAVRGLTQG